MRDILVESVGEVVEATVTAHSDYGVFVEFDVATDDGVFPVVGLVDRMQFWPTLERPKVRKILSQTLKP